MTDERQAREYRKMKIVKRESIGTDRKSKDVRGQVENQR